MFSIVEILILFAIFVVVSVVTAILVVSTKTKAKRVADETEKTAEEIENL
jgi:cell division protein FtsL